LAGLPPASLPSLNFVPPEGPRGVFVAVFLKLHETRAEPLCREGREDPANSVLLLTLVADRLAKEVDTDPAHATEAIVAEIDEAPSVALAATQTQRKALV